MKKTPVYLSMVVVAVCMYISCKKSSNDSNVSTPFADSLRKTCTQPFVGPGDSSDIYLPTAFTPNGDGINDLYRIVGRNLFPTSFSSFLLTVYDTTGKLIFRSVDASVPWEGIDSTTGKVSTKYKFYVELAYNMLSGKSASKGTFLYLLTTDSAAHCVNIRTADSSKYIFEDEFDASIPGFNPAWSSYETYCN